MKNKKFFDVLIVPGSIRAEEREFRALAAGIFLSKNQTKNILLSGGATNKVSEAKSMLNTINKYFPKIDRKNIYLEEKSKDTSSNLANSQSLIIENNWQNVGILSNNYHIKRILKLANNFKMHADAISMDEILVNYDSAYKEKLKKYYETDDMKSIIKYEFVLNKLLGIDSRGIFPKTLSNLYFKFKR